MFLYLGPADTNSFVISWRRKERLLREHVSQTCCHPNDDKLRFSPPLASQSSPDLGVLHVRLLWTEMCSHRTEPSFNEGPFSPSLALLFLLKIQRNEHTRACEASGVGLPETAWWTERRRLLLISAERGLVSRATNMMSANSAKNNSGPEFSHFCVDTEATWWNASAPADVRRQVCQCSATIFPGVKEETTVFC